MAIKSNQVKRVIRDFGKAVSQRIHLDKIILFGSRAHGKARRESDIDLAVISSSFSGMTDVERIMLLSDLARNIATPKNIAIDPLGFTIEELKDADYFNIAAEIRDQGKTVYSH